VTARTATPDLGAIRRFVSVVFGGVPGTICCRVLAERGDPDSRPRTRYFLNDARLADALFREAETACRTGSACFVVPGAVERAGRAKAQDIAATSVLLVDLDADDVVAKRNHLAEHLGPPTLEVASGGLTESGQRKLHLYWRLAAPAAGSDLAEVGALRGSVARKVGGDPAYARLTQPIRVAGSVHCKHGAAGPEWRS
jgi:putative DNA primase/helicase